MRGRFVAAAGQIQIGDLICSENAQAVEALWGKIDAARRGGGGDEEHMLTLDEFAVGGAGSMLENLRRRFVLCGSPIAAAEPHAKTATDFVLLTAGPGKLWGCTITGGLASRPRPAV